MILKQNIQDKLEFYRLALNIAFEIIKRLIVVLDNQPPFLALKKIGIFEELS